ncbi:MAG TPA: aspartate-semialdehyde dehydrogenase [Actinomycetota bacterium]|nr:aspartate-semialdehyde dehydrogenase [Actinomycetota bacterium]
MNVAVIGATGAVGTEMMRVLEERDFPVDRFVPLASLRSAGSRVTFRGEEHEVGVVGTDATRDVDVAFVSIGATASREVLPAIAAGGTVCIDNSSAFRMDPDVPLAVPDVNPEALAGWPRPGVIAVPNCTTITVVLALAPLHRAATCTSLVLSSYQAVSGAGRRGVTELVEQVDKLRGAEDMLAHPDVEALPSGPVMGRTIAYNVVPRIGQLDEDGFTGEERKIMAEPRKIMDAPDMDVMATSVRVPVIAGHAVSMSATFARPISAAEARDVLAGAPGVTLLDDPARDLFPTPLDAAGGDGAVVGRIRQIPGRDDALALFSCADNLRIGAALDAIRIAEHLWPR